MEISIKMKMFSLVVVLVVTYTSCSSQDSQKRTYPIPEDVTTLDGIIKASYEVVSGKKGEARNWERDHSLHHPKAVYSYKPRGSSEQITFSLSEFHKDTEKLVVQDGFYESEVAREIKQFGNTAHVWSSYETRTSPKGEVIQRGINSIQLYNDGERWWIISWVFDRESHSNPIPANMSGPLGQSLLKSHIEGNAFRELNAGAKLQVPRSRVYLIAGLLLVVLLGLLIPKRIKKKKEQKGKTHLLKNEIEQAQHDLQSQSLQLIRANNLIVEIEGKLKELKPKLSDHNSDIQRLINTVRMSKVQEKDWENITNYFTGIYSGFIHQLKQQFPTLTVSELRLCTLLKMNLLNCEIAATLNIETRSVVMSKYRLKKKLNLDADVDILSFLTKVDLWENESRYA